jgi:hypothetical protein
VVPYSPSPPLRDWLGARREPARVLLDAHAACRTDGRPIAQAYVVRVVAEFQGFATDLHSHAVTCLVTRSERSAAVVRALTAAAAHGRALERGNATLRNIADDFARLGVPDLAARIAVRNPHWRGSGERRGDRTGYEDLLALRNGLAHGNTRQLDRLRKSDVTDTLTWTRQQLPVLDRLARALDGIVWDHLVDVLEGEPW